ncbi:MAG: hypothetical protein ACR2K5_04920 [Pseudolabrys sp.]
MRKLVLIAAAVGLLTLPALVQAPQAKADSVTVGPGGVTVRDNDRDGFRRRDHDRDDWRYRRHWRRERAECRTVAVRHRRPDGTIVIRKTRSC